MLQRTDMIIITYYLYVLTIVDFVITDIYYRYSYHKSQIEHLISITDSFTWEELPTRDRDTGHLTKAGYIPLIQKVINYVLAIALTLHVIQSTLRIVLYHDMVFTAWYPFDVSMSPAYEIANLTQVISKL
jgi:hypothetical protein